MARFEKYKAHEVGRIFLHNNREPDDNVEHSNENIDNERTMFNYHFKKGTPSDLRERLSEIYSLRRSDQTVMGGIIVTLPKDVRQGDERTFFSAVYDFYCNDFGEKNIINAVVHNDEITPHIHIDFVPVVTGDVEYGGTKNKGLDEWKNKHDGELERLCCKDLISRQYLSQMHRRLSEHIEKELGYKVKILNGATKNGNKTVLQLKLETLMQETEKRERINEYLSEEIQKMYRLAQKLGIGENDIGLLPLMARIDDLENQNKVLQEIILRNRCIYSKEDIEKLKAKSYVSSKSASVNVYDGSLVSADIPKDAIVVIELYDKRPRTLPQESLIKNDEVLYSLTSLALRSPEKVICKSSMASKRQYLFIKTDNDRQTAQNILEMEQQLREMDLRNKKLFMDRIETDRYDLARSVLTKLDIDAQYYTRRDLQIKTEQREQEQNRQKQ